MDYYFENNTDSEKTFISKRTPAFKEIFEWLDAVVISVIAVILLFTFIFRTVGIKGESMEDTLFENDHVVISNLFYSPKQGDIVVISRNYSNLNGDTNADDSPIIKRVIAVAGQDVTIDPSTGKVMVDDMVLSEKYIKEGGITTWGDGSTEPKTITVEEGKIFVMGDNREDSLDSRYAQIGQVDTRYVLGRAIFRIYPFSAIGGL